MLAQLGLWLINLYPNWQIGRIKGTKKLELRQISTNGNFGQRHLMLFLPLNCENDNFGSWSKQEKE